MLAGWSLSLDYYYQYIMDGGSFCSGAEEKHAILVQTCVIGSSRRQKVREKISLRSSRTYNVLRRGTTITAHVSPVQSWFPAFYSNKTAVSSATPK